MFRRKHLHPFRNKQFNLADWKFIKDFFQDSGHIFFSELFTVHCQSGYPIFLFQIFYSFSGFLTVWGLGVYQDQKRFSLGFQFFYCLFFCRDKIFSGDLPEASVCCNYNSDGGMLADHFFRSDAGRIMKWDCFFLPGRFDHPFPAFFHISGRIFYQKSHTVDKLYPDFLVFPYGYFHRFFWNKFGFYSRDHFPGTA